MSFTGNTPTAADLFLQVFSHNVSLHMEEGVIVSMQYEDWGRVWLHCAEIALKLREAQALADLAIAVAPNTPQEWPPRGNDS